MKDLPDVISALERADAALKTIEDNWPAGDEMASFASFTRGKIGERLEEHRKDVVLADEKIKRGWDKFWRDLDRKDMRIP